MPSVDLEELHQAVAAANDRCHRDQSARIRVRIQHNQLQLFLNGDDNDFFGSGNAYDVLRRLQRIAGGFEGGLILDPEPEGP